VGGGGWGGGGGGGGVGGEGEIRRKGEREYHTITLNSVLQKNGYRVPELVQGNEDGVGKGLLAEGIEKGDEPRPLFKQGPGTFEGGQAGSGHQVGEKKETGEKRKGEKNAGIGRS